MKKKLSTLLVVALAAATLFGCANNSGGQTQTGGSDSQTGASESGDLKEVTLILDYTPNTNHTGFYVAKELGYYAEEGLDVTIIEPDDTSAGLVAAGRGQFGVSYQEDVTYALSAAEPLPIKTIATIIQHNTSGFISLKEAGIESPKDFVGKTYAGWGAPSEEAAIDAIMKQDGVEFENLEDVINIVGADGAGAASLSAETGSNNVNILWEFEAWNILRATMDGVELNYQACKDLDKRLDYYTPIIITSNDMIENDRETVAAFMRATKKGYEFAIEDPQGAADILSHFLPDVDIDFLYASQEFISDQYSLDSDTWGLMKDEVWDNYTDFMYEYGLIDTKVPASEMYTNEFIQ